MAFTADDIRANREYLANRLRAMSIRSWAGWRCRPRCRPRRPGRRQPRPNLAS